MNFWDIIILCGVVALVILAIRLYRGKRKSGGCCGSGSCAAPGRSSGSGSSAAPGRSSGSSSSAVPGGCSGNCCSCRKYIDKETGDHSDDRT